MPIHCLNCKSNQVNEIVEEDKVYYLCSRCQYKSGKALIIDGKIKVLNTSRGIKHICVAALIVQDGKVLMTKRRTYPFGLEIPIGHLEYNETLDDALVREVFEEVGLRVTSHTLLAQLEYPISYCRYGSDIEEWAVYLVECDTYQAFANNSESEAVEWVPLEKLSTATLSPMTALTLDKIGYLLMTETRDV